MVNSSDGRWAPVLTAAIAVALFGFPGDADSAPVPNPYGALVRSGVPATAQADVQALARGLARRGTAALHDTADRPDHAVMPDADRATGDADLMTDVVFAAPTFPVAPEVSGLTAARRRFPEIGDDLIFAAPSGPAPAMILDRQRLGAGDGTAAPASGSTAPERSSMVAAGGDAPPLTSPEIVELKRQARERLATGSIVAARAILEKAATQGDAEAQYMLGRTFDPKTLAQDGAVGLAADPGRAAELYRLARIGGYPVPD